MQCPICNKKSVGIPGGKNIDNRSKAACDQIAELADKNYN